MNIFKRLFKKEDKHVKTVIEDVVEEKKEYRATDDGHYLIDYNKVQTLNDIKLLLRFAVEKVPANHFRVEYIEHLIQTDDYYIDSYNFRVDMSRSIDELKQNLEELRVIASKYADREISEMEENTNEIH